MVGVVRVAEAGPSLPEGKLSMLRGGGTRRVSESGRGDCDGLLGDVDDEVSGEKLPGALPEWERCPPAEPEADDEFMVYVDCA